VTAADVTGRDRPVVVPAARFLFAFQKRFSGAPLCRSLRSVMINVRVPGVLGLNFFSAMVSTFFAVSSGPP
jgi:hypothetical protein